MCCQASVMRDWPARKTIVTAGPGERDLERLIGLLDALVDALIQGHEGHVMRSPATTTTIMRMSDFDG